MSSQPGTVSVADIPQLLEQFGREQLYGRRVSFDLRNGEVSLIRIERTTLVNPAGKAIPHQGVESGQ